MDVQPTNGSRLTLAYREVAARVGAGDAGRRLRLGRNSATPRAQPIWRRAMVCSQRPTSAADSRPPAAPQRSAAWRVRGALRPVDVIARQSLALRRHLGSLAPSRRSQAAFNGFLVIKSMRLLGLRIVSIRQPAADPGISTRSCWLAVARRARRGCFGRTSASPTRSACSTASLWRGRRTQVHRLLSPEGTGVCEQGRSDADLLELSERVDDAEVGRAT
jgi:hypothetical protein